MTSTNFGISECRDHDLLQQHGEVWFQAAIQIAVTEYHAKKAVSHISKELSMGVVKAIKQRVEEEVLQILGDMQESEEQAGGVPMTSQYSA